MPGWAFPCNALGTTRSAHYADVRCPIFRRRSLGVGFLRSAHGHLPDSKWHLQCLSKEKPKRRSCQ
eukprot:1934318-Amphidinium_carterae.1